MEKIKEAKEKRPITSDKQKERNNRIETKRGKVNRKIFASVRVLIDLKGK